MLTTEGIIFRQTRFKESSLIIDIFTKEHGLLTFIINGVYTKNNQRLASLLQLMNIVQLEAYYSENKNMHRIKEVSPSVIYINLPYDIKRSATGTFMLEVCRKSIKGHSPNDSLFEFLKQRFIYLDTTDKQDSFFHLHFLIDLSNHLGFYPLDNYSDSNPCFDLLNGSFSEDESKNIHLVNPTDSLLLAKLFRKDPPEEFIKNLDQRRKVLNHLLTFYKFHVEQFNEIKSLTIFKEIF